MNSILGRIIFAFALSCPCVLHAVTGEATTGNVTVDTRQAYLTLQSTTGGEISGAGGYTVGSNATLTATPAQGYVFSGWTGDASGTSNPLSLTMDADKTVGATFEPDLAAISGVVTNESGVPLLGINVAAYQYRQEYGGYYSQVSWATSNSNGEYSIQGLSQGAYRIQFYDSNQQYLPEYYDNALTVESAQDITVMGSGRVSGVDASLSKASSISGFVADANGLPIQSIQVSVYTKSKYGNWWNWSSSATTGSDGHYTVSGLRAGTYRIGFSDSQGNYAPEYYNNVLTLESAQDMIVTEAQEVSGIDASLVAASKITGVVTGPDGVTPLAGISVTAYEDRDNNGSWNYGYGVTTNANGEYSIKGLLQGTYRVKFGDSMNKAYAPKYYGGSSTISAAADVVLAQSSTRDDIDASLADTSVISGMVTDSDGVPLEGISVSIRQYDEYDNWWNWLSDATTNSNGEYFLSGFGGGAYRVGFYDMSGSYVPEYYDNALTVELAQDIVVLESEEVTDIDASLVTASRITGVVTGPDGVTPLAGIQVMAFEDRDNDGWWDYVTSETTDENGEYSIGGLSQGTYRLRFHDDEGVYAIKCYGGSSWIHTAADIILPQSSTKDDINISLSNASTISGRVTDSDGLPLEDISVSIHQYDADDDSWHWVTDATTNPNGEYSLLGIGEGAYRVEFRDYYGEYAFEAYNDAANIELADDIELAESALVTGIDAELSKASSISGKVTGLNGIALNNVEIDLERLGDDGDWHWHADAETDEDGGYDFGGLSAGVYRMEFEDESGQYALEYYNNAVEFDLATNINLGIIQNLTIDASMVPGSRITGTVTGPDGAPLPDVWVDALRLSSTGKWEFYEDVKVNADGTYQLGGLPNGTYRVGFSEIDYFYAFQFHGNTGTTMYFDSAKDFVINSPQTISGVNGQFKEKASIISGKVTNMLGVPLHDVLIEAYRKDEQGAWRLVLFGDLDASDQGVFDAEPLPAGTYRFKFEKEGYFTTYYGNSTTLANAKDIVVGESQTIQGINVMMDADSDGDGLTDGWELGIGRFSIVAGSFTWAGARKHAQSRGGDLACFPTQSVWERMLESLDPAAFDDYIGLWIGASDAAQEGTWTWVNGTAFSFSNWASTRPSAATNNTLDYAEVSGGGGGELFKWYDRSGANTRDGYLLEMGRATDPAVADADGDGLNDGQEQTAKTHPGVADSDGDGLKDGAEINLTQSNPLSTDSDGDTISDANEDPDADGLSNLLEVNTHGTNPRVADTDGDGYSDSYEVSNSSNPLNASSFPTYQLTLSSGGVVTGGSFAFTGNLAHGTNATLTATPATGYVFSSWSGNATGTSNPLTLLMNGNKTVGAAFAQDSRDPDADGLTNYQELIEHGTNPNQADSNADGLRDGLALALGKNPNENHSAFVTTLLAERAQLGLRTDSDYTDLRVGSMSVQRAPGSNKLQFRMKLQKSTNLLNWQYDSEAVFEVPVDPSSPKLFYRFGLK